VDGALAHHLQRLKLHSSNFLQVTGRQPGLLCPNFPPQGELVGLPRGLSYGLVSRGWVSSLKEFCLRQLHSLLPSSLSLSVATTPGLALHLVSVHRPPKSGSPLGFPPGTNPPGPPHLKPNHPPSTAALHCLGLTASLVSLLSAGPVSFCCNPTCCSPLYLEATVEVVPVRIQRGLAWSGEVEEAKILALRLYCQPSCYRKYKANAQEVWEQKLLEEGETEGQIVSAE